VRKLKIDLRSHAGERIDLVIVVGEHSGDQHAAVMVKEIKKMCHGINIVAFGGRALKEAGADIVFDTTKFAVVGVCEALTSIFFFKKLLGQILLWIDANRPRAVCLVDCPDFNLRLAKMLFDRGLSTKSGGTIKVLYYISPQIWAWRAKRKYQMAKLVDSLGVILPFEKRHFVDAQLDVNFVGHPFVSPSHVSNISHNQNGPILLLPGSRISAIRRIFPALLKSFQELLKVDGNRMAVVVYPDESALAFLRKILNKKFPKLVNCVTFIADGESVEACAAIMSSGTMSLRCCLAGIPGAIVYKVHPLTYSIGRTMVNIKFFGIANILLDRCVWREFLQSQLHPKAVAGYILQCLKSEKIRNSFTDASNELRNVLSVNEDTSAAKWILSSLKAHD
jgi:lipid-A-disaccharide synthase